jgi:hypothetical protein
MFYRDFPSTPLILVITLQDRKTLFCVFLRFRDLPGLKLTWDCLGVNILPWEEPGAQEVNEGGHEAHLSTGGAGSQPGHATHARLSLQTLMLSISVSTCSAWPKNAYIKTPSTIAIRRQWRNMKYRNRSYSSEDWRGKCYRSRLRTLLHPLRCQHHHHRHGEWVVHLCTMGLW